MDSPLHSIPDLEPGEHLCWLYETEQEHRAVMTPFLRQGLEQGQKVLYVVDARTPETITGYLRDDGLDVEPYLARGQLEILGFDQVYVPRGLFEPEAMIALLREETRRALTEGFRALRATGEMSWALRGLPGSERLIDYEIRLNQMLPGSKCLAVCQYDRRRFGPDILLDVLTAHPICVAGVEIYDNFYYSPPEDLLAPDVSARKLRNWLNHLAERKRAELALRQAEERFRVAFEKAAISMARAGPDGHFLDVNEAACRMLGYSREELLARDFLSITHPDDAAASLDFARRLLAGEFDRYRMEKRYLRKDGQVVWALLAVSLVRDSAGAPVSMIGQMEDITERKRVEEELAESRRRVEHLARAEEQRANWLATVLDRLPAGVIIASAQGELLANKAVERILGVAASEIKNLRDYVRLCRVLRAEGTLLRTEELALLRALRGEAVAGCEETLVRPDGRQVPLALSALPLKEAGRITGAIVVFWDISDQKEIQRRLEEVNRLQDEFLSMASHELKTPVTSIRIFSEMAVSRPEGLTPELGRRLLRQADQLVRLVNDLLEVSRLGLGRMPLKLSPLDLTALVKEVCEQPLLEPRRILWASSASHLIVEGDAARLEQVFSNLLDNALKYSPEGGPVRVRMRRNRRRAIVEVHDEGIGIAAKDLPHIFERFYKPGSQQSVYSGLGVGLYISKQIVERHGGRIWAESKKDKGSAFYVELPLAG